MFSLPKSFSAINLPTLSRYYRFLKRRFYRAIGMKGRTAWISAEACYAHFVGGEHPESPKRLMAIEKILHKTHIWARMQKVEAGEINDIQLARVHTRRYIASLEQQIPEHKHGVIKINEDTYLSQDTLKAARHGAGAAITAVNMVMKKHAKNAFCAIRPPGHHAHADEANGFCFINNAAVAAMHAIAEYRLERIAIIDFDLHHGDGTQAIFQNDPRVMLLSSFEYPLYPFANEQDLAKLENATAQNPNIVISPLKAGDDGEVFREMVRRVWLPKLASFRPQMIVLSSGFDGHRDDAIGHLRLTEEDYAWLTEKVILVAQRHAQGRIVSLLEGGYNPDSLATSVKAHLGCLIAASRF